MRSALGAVKWISVASGAFLSASFVQHKVSHKLNCQLSTSSPTGDIFSQRSPESYLQNRSTFELVRSLLIFKACGSSTLISWTPTLISTAEALHLTWPLYFGIRHSFFAHFCGGETRQDCVQVQSKLMQTGISSILDLSVEADLAATGSSATEDADRCVESIRGCVDTASSCPGNSVAVKATALGRTESMLAVSSALLYARDLFDLNADSNGRCLYGKVVSKLPGFDPARHCTTNDAETPLDWFEFRELVNLKRTPELFVGAISLATVDFSSKALRSRSLKYTPTPCKLEDIEDLKQTYGRLENICEYAKSKQVSIMIDAYPLREQSYFQPAIDELAVELMRQFNSDKQAIVYNTYQFYLKDGLQKLKTDLLASRRHGYVFCAKLVRGAYMISERKRSLELGLVDPINESIAKTHAAYDEAVALMVEWASLPDTVNIIVASHNKQSILKAISLMNKFEISKRSVQFAQLLGMHDHLTFTLAGEGYAVAKYVPYGPVEEVIPYLTRRAQENHAIFGKKDDQGGDSELAMDDLSILWRELKRRFSQKFA